MSDPRDVDPQEIGGDLPPLDPELAAWLATDPAPPMPTDVWARLEASLAAEPSLVPAGVVDLEAERTRRRPRRVLPLLVGAGGLVLVGAVVLPTMQTASPPPVADGAVSGQPAVAVTTPTEGGSAGSDGTGAPAPDASPPLTAPAPGMPRAMVATGTDYTADALPAQVTTLLASTGMVDRAAIAEMMATPLEDAASAMPGTGLASSPEALADCLGRLGLPAGSVPLLLDTSTVEGVQGSVIVTVGASDTSGVPTSLHVVAVGQDCGDDDVATARHWDLPLG